MLQKVISLKNNSPKKVKNDFFPYISLPMSSIVMTIPLLIVETVMKGTVSQIFYLGPSFFLCNVENDI